MVARRIFTTDGLCTNGFWRVNPSCVATTWMNGWCKRSSNRQYLPSWLRPSQHGRVSPAQQIWTVLRSSCAAATILITRPLRFDLSSLSVKRRTESSSDKSATVHSYSTRSSRQSETRTITFVIVHIHIRCLPELHFCTLPQLFFDPLYIAVIFRSATAHQFVNFLGGSEQTHHYSSVSLTRRSVARTFGLYFRCPFWIMIQLVSAHDILLAILVPYMLVASSSRFCSLICWKTSVGYICVIIVMQINCLYLGVNRSLFWNF
jgi:hypothetical protein